MRVDSRLFCSLLGYGTCPTLSPECFECESSWVLTDKHQQSPLETQEFEVWKVLEGLKVLMIWKVNAANTAFSFVSWFNVLGPAQGPASLPRILGSKDNGGYGYIQRKAAGALEDSCEAHGGRRCELRLGVYMPCVSWLLHISEEKWENKRLSALIARSQRLLSPKGQLTARDNSPPV